MVELEVVDVNPKSILNKKMKKKAKNHIGEVHGWLTIESYFLKGKNYWYNCKCKCGNCVQVIEKIFLVEILPLVDV